MCKKTLFKNLRYRNNLSKSGPSHLRRNFLYISNTDPILLPPLILFRPLILFNDHYHPLHRPCYTIYMSCNIGDNKCQVRSWVHTLSHNMLVIVHRSHMSVTLTPIILWPAPPSRPFHLCFSVVYVLGWAGDLRKLFFYPSFESCLTPSRPVACPQQQQRSPAKGQQLLSQTHIYRLSLSSPTTMCQDEVRPGQTTFSSTSSRLERMNEWMEGCLNGGQRRTMQYS